MPPYRLEIGFSKKKFDFVSAGVLAEIREDLGIKSAKSLEFAEFYDISLDEPPKKIAQVCEEVFSDPITQKFFVNEPACKEFDLAVEVKLHTGITDNVAIIATRAVEDFLSRKLKENENVSYGRKYFFNGTPSEEETMTICTGLLSNPQIEDCKVIKR
ncbi:MAG: hypothetical protein HY392_05080 [Candidatus Diapherotrites archaeon]|nr:hypothetical protein [Candidatus Diapherotrites archaeon]